MGPTRPLNADLAPSNTQRHSSGNTKITKQVAAAFVFLPLPSVPGLDTGPAPGRFSSFLLCSFLRLCSLAGFVIPLLINTYYILPP